MRLWIYDTNTLGTLLCECATVRDSNAKRTDNNSQDVARECQLEIDAIVTELKARGAIK